MMKEEKNKASSILDMAMLVTPVIMLPQLGESLNTNIPELALSALLGGIGGGIGFVLMWTIKEKQIITKSVALAALFLLFTLGIASQNPQTESAKRALLTCQICGYKAIPSEGVECEVCFIPITETFRQDEGYDSMEEMIVEEQLLFFSIEEDVEVNRPEIYSDGELRYNKDPQWKPMFTMEQYESWLRELEVIEEKIDFEVDTNQ